MQYPPPDPWPSGVVPHIGLMDVRSLYFVGKTIPVGGYRYTNCRFDNCQFLGGVINMENCQINPAEGKR